MDWVFGASYDAGPVTTDVSALCGQTATVDLVCFGPGAMTIPPGTALFDDVTAAGAVCPSFVDADGDGRCAQGLDLDLDGVCVADGEPWAPGAPADCDDAVFGPRRLAITAATATAGGTAEVTAAGATPGETVWGRPLPPPRTASEPVDRSAPAADHLRASGSVRSRRRGPPPSQWIGPLPPPRTASEPV
ncbi:MAG: hypothetical protein ABMB14_37280, partial [Myxococcota bacterium]